MHTYLFPEQIVYALGPLRLPERIWVKFCPGNGLPAEN